jgi:hypothetical protein
VNHAVEFGSYFLKGGQMPSLLSVRDGFPTFGVGIDSRGQLVEFNCLPAPGRPGAFNVFLVSGQLDLFVGTPLQQPSAEGRIYFDPIPVEFLANGVKQWAANGSVHAVALVDRVEVPATDGAEKTHAIRMQIEHVETDPVTWFQPYRSSNGEVAFGERSSNSGRPSVFK